MISVAHAADPRYPDWPCAQAKVPEISLAAVWAGPPLDDIAGKWKEDATIGSLITKVAARRTTLEDAQKAITDYLKGAADKTASGKLLFSGLFDVLNGQRSQALQGATPPDQAKVDELGNQLVWQTRIFEDRQRVIKFVCEVPTAIDQRLFGLSRTIQQEIE
uniref:Signal peptide protein n=1 Tax=Globodera pallida TaxID=36090 RepID=A0A183C454_GLOPA